MPKEHLQPSELFASQPLGFTQVVTSPPGKLVFCSGQVAWDKDLKLVGGDDLAAQGAKAVENLGHALAAAGATPADLTSLRIYIANYEPEDIAVLGPVLGPFLKGAPAPAQTLIGVQSLAVPGLRIEIEATAVVGG